MASSRGAFEETDSGKRRAMARPCEDADQSYDLRQGRSRRSYSRKGLLPELSGVLRHWQPLSPEECSGQSGCGTLPAWTLDIRPAGESATQLRAGARGEF